MRITYNDVPYYVSGPDTSTMGLIIVSEWWGLNDQIMQTCDRFAESLQAKCIAPDLYRGKVTVEKDEANHLFSSLNWIQAVEDIKIATEWLKSQGCQKVGIFGFCMGGALSIAGCCLVDGIDCGACFYGIPSKSLCDPATLKKPMQFHFGNKDTAKGFSDPEACDTLRDTIQHAGILKVDEVKHATSSYSQLTRNGDKFIAEFHRYDADHAFMNTQAIAYPYNKEVADLATKHLIDFLNVYLK
jgi:carboxymethylenebutenolidase